MKITALLLFAASFAGLGNAVSDRQHCANKNGNLMKAIDSFCANKALTVPSVYAKRGMKGPDKHTRIWIDGNQCQPFQWVPPKYCKSQFWNLCKRGGAHGGGVTRFGRDGCQVWKIKYNRHV